MGKLALTKTAIIGLTLVGCFTISALGSQAAAHDDHDIIIPTVNGIETPNVKFFHYSFDSNTLYNSTYDLIWEAMQPTYKNTDSDKDSKFPANPVIGTVEFDLNADKSPEVIAYPVEDSEFPNAFCGKSMLCPHYVLDFSSGKARVLGVVRAFAVDRGDEIKNGYWTLKAFTKQDDPDNFSYYDVYVYDKKKKAYEKTPVNSHTLKADKKIKNEPK